MEPLKSPERKRKHIYKPPIFGFHVSFQGCKGSFIEISDYYFPSVNQGFGNPKDMAHMIWYPQKKGSGLRGVLCPV